MMETEALAVATAAMAVLVGLIAWFDLKQLRIPNWSVLAVIAVFLVTGLWGLEFSTYLWRILYGVIVLFVGFGLYQFAGGHIGGGDIKLIAALTPFIAGSHLLFVLTVFAVLSIVGVMLHKLIRNRLKERTTGWAALDQKRFFPAGLLLGGTIMIYMVTQLGGGFAA